MTFLWMQMLWLLLLIPVLVLAYLYILRRKSRAAVRYANLPLVREAMGRGPGFRRHIPPILFLASLTVLILAIARPAAVITLASQRATILLAMDVSGSMRARDVDPDRFTASKAAAKEFIRGQPKDVRIGIVAFAGTAFLVQSPTTVKEDLEAAIDRFEMQRGTATGSGILVSLQNIFPNEDIDLGQPRMDDPLGNSGANGGARLGEQSAQPKKAKPAPVPPGSFQSALIIVMTDGQTTTGPDPVEAARVAADHGVRVFTVGFGSPDGEVVGWGGWSMRTQLDEASLKQVADMTKGQYFRATTSEELKKIYQGLNTQLIKERRETEITAFFAAAAGVLALLAAGLSMLWYSRIL
jgi:Ca-activated chloride channel family protein